VRLDREEADENCDRDRQDEFGKGRVDDREPSTAESTETAGVMIASP
jgi:hypothetical protein